MPKIPTHRVGKYADSHKNCELKSVCAFVGALIYIVGCTCVAKIYHSPCSIIDFWSAGKYHTINGRLQIQTRASRQIFWVAGVLFPHGAQSGRRARRAAH